ncbi:MAG: class II aldolase/adducin family protein, partial [Lachnospiraceae bacterium]
VDCCLLQSHGAIAIGTDMEEAFLKAQYVEEVAELYYLTLTAMGGKEPTALPAEELKKWAYPSEIKL